MAEPHFELHFRTVLLRRVKRVRQKDREFTVLLDQKDEASFHGLMIS